jgi:xanthine/CO dehydrogenase XdhC/CoxF family maturation factor
VLFEPLDIHAKVNPVKLLEKAIAKRQRSVLVTLFSAEEKNKPQIGTCLLVEEDNTITGEIPFEEIKELIMDDVKLTMQTQTTSFKNYFSGEQNITAFIEFLQTPISLVVVGAGNDAVPLVNIADMLGWEARIVDGRNTHAKPERFTSACQVLVSKPEHVLEQIPIDKQTAFVLLTHNYNYDLAMLKELLKRNVEYIGLLGPKKKLERMLDELKSQGMNLTKEQLDSIYGPVGLEIGAETAEEIAISIIAEIKAVFSGKSGTLLRDSHDYIHPRLFTEKENRKLH